MNESSLNSMLDNLYKANYCYNCNKLDRRKIRFRFDFNPFVQFILSLSLCFSLLPMHLVYRYFSSFAFVYNRNHYFLFLESQEYRFINIKR